MWTAFKDWIFSVIQFFYNICGDWGLSIIIVTIIFRLILLPLMYRQARSNYQMQKIQPEVNRIREKYADDKVRQNEEMQKIYANARFNPIAGCLPMILQIPIFMALFQTLREMSDRAEVQDYTFYNIIPNLVTTPSDAFSSGFGTFIPYLILMIIFAGATFTPMILQQLQNNGNQQRTQTLAMGVIMTIFMLFISWSSPAGVLLYWGTSSLIGVLQNQWSMHHFRSVDAKKEKEKSEEEVEIEPVEVNVTRKVKKPRPTKKK